MGILTSTGAWDLKFPETEEGKQIETYLSRKSDWLPGKGKVLLPLKLIKPENIKVVIFGQDPYPNAQHATGIPFEVPNEIHWTDYPPTLKNIFREYTKDTGFPYPPTGSLRKWIKQGVFLWNVVPTCKEGVSLSHNFPQYEELTKEIMGTIHKATAHYGGVIYVFMGAVARQYVQYVPEDDDDNVIELSHPSPRGSMSGKHPFRNSRVFTTVNSKLSASGMPTVNWRLSEKGVYGESNNVVKNIEVRTDYDYDTHLPPSKDVWREDL